MVGLNAVAPQELRGLLTPQMLFLAGKAVAQLIDSQTYMDEATAGFAAEIPWITTTAVFLAAIFNQSSK